MTPFTLQWWMHIRNEFTVEYFKIYFEIRTGTTTGTSSVITPEQQRLREVNEILIWIEKRIINKYGE